MLIFHNVEKFYLADSIATCRTSRDYMHMCTSDCQVLANPGCPNRLIPIKADSRMDSPLSHTSDAALAARMCSRPAANLFQSLLR
ncbi:unnamed protein product [Schistocephalus solidus]|uniref:Uncharacterized protein n=1 Tax=Schistocephalus solidus TaxID=70667 RepID=A0A183T1D1_SCHSO|nr:unnamed protein product [Schistocephalus solidus]